MRLSYYALTHKGLVRSENQDTFLVFSPKNQGLMGEKGLLFLVADGAGGHEEGALASRLAAETIRDYYFGLHQCPPQEALKKAISEAHEKIKKLAEEKNIYMATTVTALIAWQQYGLIGHVGDSRLYLLRNKLLSLLTKDHTLVEELVDQKVISREEARKHPQRNVLTQALGIRIDPLIRTFPLQPYDILLLSTDGLHDYVSEEEIKEILLKYPPKEAGQNLIQRALDAGGYDNITAIVIHCLDNDTKS